MCVLGGGGEAVSIAWYVFLTWQRDQLKWYRVSGKSTSRGVFLVKRYRDILAPVFQSRGTSSEVETASLLLGTVKLKECAECHKTSNRKE